MNQCRRSHKSAESNSRDSFEILFHSLVCLLLLLLLFCGLELYTVQIFSILRFNETCFKTVHEYPIKRQINIGNTLNVHLR